MLQPRHNQLVQWIGNQMAGARCTPVALKNLLEDLCDILLTPVSCTAVLLTMSGRPGCQQYATCRAGQPYPLTQAPDLSPWTASQGQQLVSFAPMSLLIMTPKTTAMVGAPLCPGAGMTHFWCPGSAARVLGHYLSDLMDQAVRSMKPKHRTTTMQGPSCRAQSIKLRVTMGEPSELPRCHLEQWRRQPCSVSRTAISHD